MTNTVSGRRRHSASISVLPGDMTNKRPAMYGMMLTLALLIAVTAAAEGEEKMLQAGQPFAAFELTAHDGSTVDSADLAGKPFLLFFYPKASTPG